MTTLTINGASYSYPAVGDADNWGPKLIAVASALSTSTLQKSGGTFTLTADVDFGATYGLKTAYYKSRGTNPASTGVIRLANAEGIAWRNNANSADKTLTVNASDQLTYGGTKLLTSGAIVNADIDAAAAIALSKLAALTASRALVSDGSGVVSVSAVTSTELGYVSGVTSAIQTQIDGKQPLDSDLTAVAGLSSTGLVARTGSGTAAVRTISAGSSKISISNGDGVSGNPSVDVSESNLTLNNIGGTLGISKGGTGQTTANAALNALLPTQSGAAGKVLSSNGTDTSWASAASSTLTQYYTDIGDSGNSRTATNTNLLGDIKASTGSATVTITIASPGVVSLTSHGLSTGDKVYLTTTGALPTGLSASTTYYVVKVDANSFKLTSSYANAVATTPTVINTSGSQSGTHTLFYGGLTRQFVTAYLGTGLTFTPSAGYGTPSDVKFAVWRIGNLMKVKAHFKAGTVSATTASIALPSGYTIDYNVFSTAASGQACGKWWNPTVSGTVKNISSGDCTGPIFVDGSTTGSVFLTLQGQSSAYLKVSGSTTSTGNNSPFDLDFEIPIVEWA